MKRSASLLVVLLVLLFAEVALAEQIPNWLAPPTWSPAFSGGGLTKFVDLSGPLPFIPITPCRVIDTRGNGFMGEWGQPPMPGGGTQRSFTIGGQCGIPSGAAAVSFNFTVWAPPTGGDIRVFPTGYATPMAATMLYQGGVLGLSNAAVAPLGTAGKITVQVDGPGTINLIVDVNGYYSSTPANMYNYFAIYNNSATYTIWAQNYSTTCSANCGIVGRVSSGWALFGINDSTTDGGAVGVYGLVYSTADGAAGVYGKGATSGKTYGVFGEAASTAFDTAGVFGKDPHGALALPDLAFSSGVRGEGINGVTGVSDEGYGVLGAKIAAGPTLEAWGVLGYTSGGTHYGVYSFGTLGASGTKPFVEPHPTDPSKVIRYVALEGNEAGTYFRGTTRIVRGTAVIPVPETFKIVTDEEGLTVQVTPVGAPALVWIESQDLDQIVIRSEKNVTVHYLVQGFRRAYKDWQVVADGTEYKPLSPHETLPAFLSEEAKKRLVQNGTYNPDGTVNMRTAERLGWAQKWEERAKASTAPAPKVSTPPSNN